MNRILAGLAALALFTAPAHAQTYSGFVAQAQALVDENGALRTQVADAAAKAQAEAAREAGEDAAFKAEIARLNALVAGLQKPVATVPPVPAVTYVPLSIGSKDTFFGQAWMVQTDRVQAGSDGTRRVSAFGGQNASFDTPKKIRSELIGVRQYGVGEVMAVKGQVFIEDGPSIAPLQWASFLQVHQADSRYADGRAVNASPIFAADLTEIGGQLYVQVRGETAPRGDLLRDGKEGAYTYRFAPLRVFGKAPVKRGQWVDFDFKMIDGHGGPGWIYFKLGDVVIADARVNTGYGYVDDLANVPYGGRPQATASYIKFGFYGGNSALAAVPADVGVALRYRPAP